MKQARKNRPTSTLAKTVAASRGDRDLRKHCITARKSLAGIIELMERARLAVESLEHCRPSPRLARKKTKTHNLAGQGLRAMTREEAARIVARLRRLGRALTDLSLPVQIAARFVPVADLGDFTDTVEMCARGLMNLFESYLTGNMESELLSWDDRWIETEFGAAKKEMERVSKISRGEVEIEVDDKFLPPEFSPRNDQDGGEDEEISP